MELKILDKKEEPLLSRIRMEAEVIFEKATPSGQEVKSNLAKTIGKDEKLIDIKSIYTAFGLKKAKILFYAYENEEILKRIKIKKKKTEKKTKAEEKKEEVKVEVKEKDTKKEEKSDAKGEKKEAKRESKDQKIEDKKEQ